MTNINSNPAAQPEMNSRPLEVNHVSKSNEQNLGLNPDWIGPYNVKMPIVNITKPGRIYNPFWEFWVCSRRDKGSHPKQDVQTSSQPTQMRRSRDSATDQKDPHSLSMKEGTHFNCLFPGSCSFSLILPEGWNINRPVNLELCSFISTLPSPQTKAMPSSCTNQAKT